MSSGTATVSYSIAAAGAYHVLLILFGAPSFADFHKTLFAATLLSALTVVPILHTTSAQFKVICELVFDLQHSNKAQFFAVRSAAGSIVGAWLSAFVIPLDWDRWWQEWPLPIVFGSIVGSACGLFEAFIERRRAKSFEARTKIQ